MPGWMGVASGVLSGITFIGVCSWPKVSAQFQQHITHQGYKQQIAHIKKVISPPSALRAVVEPGCSCSVRCLPCQTIPGLGASSSVPSSPDGAHNPPVSSDFHVALITVTPPLFHHIVPVPPAVVEQLLPCQNSHKIENVSQFTPMSQLLAESNKVKQRRRNVVKLFCVSGTLSDTNAVSQQWTGCSWRNFNLPDYECSESQLCATSSTDKSSPSFLSKWVKQQRKVQVMAIQTSGSIFRWEGGGESGRTSSHWWKA